MTRHQRRRWAALAATFAIVAASGCDSDSDQPEGLPSDAVARVDQAVITDDEVRAVLADIATDAPSRRRLAARQLIGIEWMRREAARENLDISVSRVKAGMDPAAARTARMVARAHAGLLFAEFMERATGPTPSERQIVRYFRAHPQAFGSPEIRYMKLVATDSRAQAEAAKRALEGGKRWKAVIARYSTDRSVSPASGSTGSGPREMPPDLGSALYAARRGSFYGPVRTDDAWYAFELTAVFKQPRQTLAQTQELVVAEIRGRRGARGLNVLRRRLIANHRPETVCAETLRLPECRNGPPITATTLSLPTLF